MSRLSPPDSILQLTIELAVTIMTYYTCQKPSHCKVELTKTDYYLSICVPPYGLNSSSTFAAIIAVAMAVGLIISPLFFYPIFFSDPRAINGDILYIVGISLFLIMLFLCGFYLIYAVLVYFFVKTEFYIDRQTIGRSQWLFGHRFGNTKTIPVSGIIKISMSCITKDLVGSRAYEVPPKLIIKYPHKEVNIIENFGKYLVVGNLYNDATISWLTYEIRSWLNMKNGKSQKRSKKQKKFSFEEEVARLDALVKAVFSFSRSIFRTIAN